MEYCSDVLCRKLALSKKTSGNERYRANLLIQRYGKCGNIREARAVFDGIHLRNVYSWAIMLAAYVHNDQDEHALELFPKMTTKDGLQPDLFVFATLLGACAKLANLEQGKALHADIDRLGLRADVVLGTALVNMYAKCGAVDDAKAIFDRMPDRNVVTWTAMITAFAQAGDVLNALKLFRNMDLEGLKQNDVTYISLLSACCCTEALRQGEMIHARITALGYRADVAVQNALINMYIKCGSLPSAVHVFGCMRDRDLISWNEMILGHSQSGQNQVAVEFYSRMNLEGLRANDFTFSNILGACTAQQGINIHRCILQTEYRSSTVVQNALLNMYAKAGKLELAKTLFDGLKEPTLVSWTAVITAYAQHGQCDQAVEMFQSMNLEGLEPDGITFVSILNACVQSGLLFQCWYFYIYMLEDHRLALTQEHHACMIDMLVKAGWMNEAEELLRSLPCHSDPVLWRIILNACSMYSQVARAGRIAKIISELEPDGSQYVLLSNVYKTSE